MENKAKVGNVFTNEVQASAIKFNAVKKQNGVTTPITVNIGDVITYVISITNTGRIPTGVLPFIDTLPNGLTYLPISFQVGSVAATPTINVYT